MDHSADHIFTLPSSPRHEFAVIDSGLRRAVAIASSGNDRVVVWNPGADCAISDFDEDSWRRFVCVEPVSDWPGGRTLAPGERHVLAELVELQPLRRRMAPGTPVPAGGNGRTSLKKTGFFRRNSLTFPPAFVILTEPH